MSRDYRELMYRMNCLASDLDAIYHRAALKLGISDSVLFILYLLDEHDGKCPLNDIRKAIGISKQTLNSAIRKLECEEIIYLEQIGGRAKNVCLTEKGMNYAKNTARRLYDAEVSVFANWSEEDTKQYLSFMERYNRDFREQIEKM